MPNTLAHVGVQGAVSLALFKNSDAKWIYAACILPDLPWIFQRLALLVPGIDPVFLRAYVDVQGSLAGCLVLSAAVAFLTVSFWRLFLLFGFNAVLHLVLDALQTRWGNGVHFLAPFSWDLTNWGMFWTESFITVTLSVLGLFVFVAYWQPATDGVWSPAFAVPRGRRLVGFLVLAIAFLAGPVYFVQGPLEADNHAMQTLRPETDRDTRNAEFDRATVFRTAEGDFLYSPWNERIEVVGLEDPALPNEVVVSLRGVFEGQRRFRVLEHHVHAARVRDLASYVGILLILATWIWAEVRRSRPRLSE